MKKIPEGFHIGEVRNDLKERVIVNDGDRIYRIKREYLEEYLDNGFNIGSGGLMNFSSGFIFMNNCKEEIRIRHEYEDEYKSLGYKRGRLNKSKLKGTIKMTNGHSTINVSPEEVDKYSEIGYQKGVQKSSNRTGSSGRKYLNKDGIMVSAKTDEEFNFLISQGYTPGRSKGPMSGKIIVNNGIEEIVINKEDEIRYKELGYLNRGSLSVGHNKGRKSMTNGINNILSTPEDIEKNIKLGYWLGITRKPRKRKNDQSS